MLKIIDDFVFRVASFIFLIAFYKNILGVKQISIGVIISIILCGYLESIERVHAWQR